MRQTIHERESQTLEPWASRAGTASRRVRDPRAEGDAWRSSFQQDRDRILYSTAFRRLQYKTQVYVLHEGDFYRTRLTHTLEVMQIARTLARCLGCNEDLAEAIALAHDLGHPPFGHAGEAELAALMCEHGGFDHNLQALRIVDELERRYPDFPGLNLTFETREGLARHLTDYDRPDTREEFRKSPQPSAEAQIVSLADRIAYSTHDLDDALVGGLLELDDLEDARIPLVEEAERAATGETPGGADSQVFTRRLVRHLINLLVTDAAEHSLGRLRQSGANSTEDVRRTAYPLVGLSERRARELDALRELLERRVYHHHLVRVMNHKGRLIIRRLFETFAANPELLHPLTRRRREEAGEQGAMRVLADHLSGMTDSFALNLYVALFEPEGRALQLVVPRVPREG